MGRGARSLQMALCRPMAPPIVVFLLSVSRQPAVSSKRWTAECLLLTAYCLPGLKAMLRPASLCASLASTYRDIRAGGLIAFRRCGAYPYFTKLFGVFLMKG